MSRLIVNGFASRPEGKPTEEAFEFAEGEVPDQGPDEVLVRTVYLSIDPDMRGRMRDAESYAEPWESGDVMRAGIVGEVVESNHPEFEPGDVAFTTSTGRSTRRRREASWLTSTRNWRRSRPHEPSRRPETDIVDR